jgi:hypothetical protein
MSKGYARWNIVEDCDAESNFEQRAFLIAGQKLPAPYIKGEDLRMKYIGAYSTIDLEMRSSEERVDIFNEIKRLAFPFGEYVVVGSGIMTALGIKQSHDIDIVVTESLFEKCKESGWEVMPWTYPHRIGEIYLKRGNIELYLDVNCGDCNPTTDELINEAIVINEVPFISLERLLQFKKAYGREKHLNDALLIEQYLSSLRPIE